MKSLIITDDQAFHNVSAYCSDSADDSPDQTVNRIKIECHLPLLYTTHRPGLPLTNRSTSSASYKRLGEASRVDEDPFEEQMRLSYEAQV